MKIKKKKIIIMKSNKLTKMTIIFLFYKFHHERISAIITLKTPIDLIFFYIFSSNIPYPLERKLIFMLVSFFFFFLYLVSLFTSTCLFMLLITFNLIFFSCATSFTAVLFFFFFFSFLQRLCEI